MIINFIDFKRAFDSVHRPTMWKILRSYGIPIKIINVIKLLYEGSSSCVRVGGSNTESFEITSGLKQGDVLSPVLFVIVVDWIMRRIIDGEDGIVWVDNGRLLFNMLMRYYSIIIISQSRLPIQSFHRLLMH